MMKSIWNGMQAVLAAVGAYIGYFLGGWDGFLYALVIFVISDYISGVLVAIVEKKVSSDVGFRGIFKKILIFILVGVSYIIDSEIIKEGSDINYYLEDFISDAPDLTTEQILETKNAILVADSKATYKIDLDFNKLNSDLTEMTALIEAAAQPSNDSQHGFEELPVIESSPKSKWTFDWKSALIGSVAVVLGGLTVKGCRTLLATR